MKAEIAANVPIACNEARLAFYSDGRCDYHLFEASPADEIARLKNSGYHYLVLWVGHKQALMKAATEQDASLLLIKEFLNRKGDRAGIYRYVGAG